MNDDILTAPLTMRAFLFGTDDSRDTREVIEGTISEHGVARSALVGTRRLAGSVAGSVDREISGVLGDMLDPNLSDVLLSCWLKHRSLRQAAERTLAVPRSSEVVRLVTWRGSAAYSPYVDLLVDEKPLTTLKFEVLVVFEVAGLDASIAHGALVALAGGDCRVTGTLALDRTRLVERQRRFDATLMVRLGEGYPLVGKPDQQPQAAGTTPPV